MSGGLKSLLPKLVAATPGLPGHHIETSERHRLDTTLSRDEQAREFNHFNKRFRNKLPVGGFGPHVRVLDRKQLQLGECLRYSAESTLHLCVVDGKAKGVARMHSMEAATRQLWHEIAIWSSLSHPNIARLMGVATAGAVSVTICEYFANGSLYDDNRRLCRLATTSPSSVAVSLEQGSLGQVKGSTISAKSLDALRVSRPELVLFAWTTGIASAMAYLHALRPHPVVHRNLKSTNLMIHSSGLQLSVTDFNTACPLNQDMTPAVGSLRWMAPEVLNGHVYDERTDVYAFGMACYEMIGFVVPFAHLTTNQAALKAASGERPELHPATTPKWLHRLISACWQADPAARPNFATIVAQLDRGMQVLNARMKVARAGLRSTAASTAASSVASTDHESNEASEDDEEMKEAAADATPTTPPTPPPTPPTVHAASTPTADALMLLALQEGWSI